jgi:cell wall-active antibiotic response 4TMS protein YvqF
MNTTTNTNETVVAYCRTCGKPLSEHAKREVYGVIYCEDCLASRVHGTVPGATPVGSVPPGAAMAYVPSLPNPSLAFILGWIPGVGAMYNGQVAKGFVHVGIFALLVSILSNGAGGMEPLFGLLLAGFVFYMAFDAFQTAKALRFGQPVPDHLRILQTLEGMGMKSEAGRTGVPVNPTYVAQPGAVPNPGQPYVAQQPVGTAGVPVQPAYVVPVAATEPPPEPSGERIPISAIILIGLGAFFLLNTIGWFHLSGQFFVPVLLIGLGVWLAVRRLTGESRR